jgi:putative glutamine amidotransferase
VKLSNNISIRIVRTSVLCLTLSLILLNSIFGCSGEKSKNGTRFANEKISSISNDSTLRIGISKHYTNYSEWLLLADKNIEYYNFYTMPYDSALKLLATCDGLMLSGGPDIEPSRFGKPWDTARCEIDYRRDTLEFALIDAARKLKMPILGICRGEQILNVYYGGSLIVDIPEDYKTSIQHKCKKSDTCFHDVVVIPGTLSQKIFGVNKGKINTNHHQSIDKVAKGFVISSKSPDGIVESIEWANEGNPPSGEPFIIAVQWHPERLEPNNPFSLNLARYFLMKAREFKGGKVK